MKKHTTNYYDTFIEVAADTKAITGTKPPSKGDKKTVAEVETDNYPSLQITISSLLTMPTRDSD